MKNLKEIYNVEGLNEMELNEVNGGCIGCGIVDVIAAVAKVLLHLR